MRCSEDLRRRVRKFVRDGGSKAAAAVKFEVSAKSVGRWCACEDLAKKPGPKKAMKIDMDKLIQDVATDADAYLSERAARFGVSVSGMFYAMRRLKLVRKKNVGTPQGKYTKTA